MIAFNDMKHEIFSIHAFVGPGLQGNLAGVVILDQNIPASQMQRIAKDFGASETAFVLRQKSAPQNSPTEFQIRWFTPEMEVRLCGHGTLASAYVLWERLGFVHECKIVFHSLSGPLNCERRSDGMIFLDFPRLEVEAYEPDPLVIEALKLPNALDFRISDSYLLVQVATAAEVRTYQPNFSHLTSLPTRGLFVTAAGDGQPYDFVSRCFYPREGIPEDPVTGSAHCVLGPYWAQKLGKSTLLACQASAQGGELRVTVGESRVKLGGWAK